MTATLARPILRDPAFGRLWFIQASTQIGGNMSLYALTILVFATTRSNAAVSALVMSFLLPTILLSAVAGVLVDRLDVRWAMIVPNAIRTVLTLGLALAGANVAMLLLLNLGVSLTTVILTPAEASMIPRIVPKAQLQTAMGDLQPDAPGVVRRRVRVPGPDRRRARRSVVRARRRHRLLRGGHDHDPVPALGAAGRPRARRRSALRSANRSTSCTRVWPRSPGTARSGAR